MALLTAGLAVSGAVAVATLRAHLIERVDRQLTPMATVLARIPALLVAVPAAPQSRQLLGALPGMDLIDQVYVAYLRADGTVEQEGDPWQRDSQRDGQRRGACRSPGSTPPRSSGVPDGRSTRPAQAAGGGSSPSRGPPRRRRPPPRPAASSWRRHSAA
ncbi:hypothetical protein GCM10027612_66630 [Microbispora bryophytorum subsp. camponoti]